MFRHIISVLTYLYNNMPLPSCYDMVVTISTLFVIDILIRGGYQKMNWIQFTIVRLATFHAYILLMTTKNLASDICIEANR